MSDSTRAISSMSIDTIYLMYCFDILVNATYN